MNIIHDDQKMNLKKEKIIRILAVGDSHIGKTTFLYNFCGQQNDIYFNSEETQHKIHKTIGCDIHICKHTPNTNALIPNQDSTINTSQYSEEHIIQFWDLAGENKQREFLNIFNRDKLQKLDAILFFFDLNNLNTFRNFYKWLMAIFHNSNDKKDYASVWKIPFLLIGTKTDQIPLKYQNEIKQKLIYQLNKKFKCPAGENLLFLNAINLESPQQKVQMSMFNLFLSELCIEKTIKSNQSQTQSFSSYSELSSESSHSQILKTLNKNTSKYRLNNENYKNKRIIEEDKNLLQIVMEVNQFSEYQRTWLNQVTNITSSMLIVKDRVSDLIVNIKKQKFNKVEEEFQQILVNPEQEQD